MHIQSLSLLQRRSPLVSKVSCSRCTAVPADQIVAYYEAQQDGNEEC